MFTNKQYSSFLFQSYTHQTYKEIQSRNHVHSKPKVHQVIFGVSKYRTKDIHCRTEQLRQFKREKEREKERETERQIEIERKTVWGRYPVRDCRSEILKLNFSITYILPENNPGELSKQNKLI